MNKEVTCSVFCLKRGPWAGVIEIELREAREPVVGSSLQITGVRHDGDLDQGHGIEALGSG